MTDIDKVIFEKAQYSMMSALVQALLQTHPNPTAVYEEWKRFASIGTADWTTRAVALDVSGFGSNELKRAYDELNVRLSKLVEERKGSA